MKNEQNVQYGTAEEYLTLSFYIQDKSYINSD
jgi:hypothetical protein